MLHLFGPAGRVCNGLTRRDLLTAGTVPLIGLTVADLLRGRAAALPPGAPSNADPAPAPGQVKGIRSVIYMYMFGGPSHHETLDPKPDAPVEVRGEFNPIKTNVPGIRIAEHLPMLARCADKYAVVRSMSHVDNEHGSGGYQALTGKLHATPGVNVSPSPDDYPHIGSAVARFRPSPSSLPPFVALTRGRMNNGGGGKMAGQDAGILGRSFDPFEVETDPAQSDFRVPGMSPMPGMTDNRIARRKGLLDFMNDQVSQLDRARGIKTLDAYQNRALDLVTSVQTRQAFDLNRERDAVRDRYGRNTFGQAVLLARRLAEAGVPLISVYWSSGQAWDTHGKNFEQLKKTLLPPVDRSVSALFEDLAARGLADEVLVVWCGEFGRTPKINKDAGRDHWPHVYSLLLGGGGIRGGQVYGESDRNGAYPAASPTRPADITATIYSRLGIPPTSEIRDRQNRPLPLCDGSPVKGLLE